MWAGLRGGRDSTERKELTELGGKPFFPLGPKIEVCCQDFLSGAGWERQLLGTGVAMRDDVSFWLCMRSICGTPRAPSKIMLVLFTSCFGSGDSFSRDYSLRPLQCSSFHPREEARGSVPRGLHPQGSLASPLGAGC